MKNKILVFDDIIDLEYQERIKSILLGDETFEGYYFPWYFTQDVTSHKDENSQKRSAFYHGYVMSSDDENTVGTVNSIFHYLLNPLIENACHRVGEKNVNILKGRSFLQLPINYKGEREDTPHIDISDLYHFVMLYYVCDSDGDTIIFNEQEESENIQYKKSYTKTR